VLLHATFGDHHREVVAINWSLRVPKKITLSSLKTLHAHYYSFHSDFYISHPYSHAHHYFHTHQPISCSYSPSSMAITYGPHFNPKNPSTLCTYILDYEALAKAVQLTPGEHLAQSMHYLTKEDKDDWENLSEFEATLPDWDTVKQDLFREYPNTRKLFITSADLGRFISEKSKQEIHTFHDFAMFHWEFRRLATRLSKKKRVSADGLNRAYEKSIHPELQDKILFYL